MMYDLYDNQTVPAHPNQDVLYALCHAGFFLQTFKQGGAGGLKLF